MAGGGEGVGVEKAAYFRVVISALEVIQARLWGVVVAATVKKAV